MTVGIVGHASQDLAVGLNSTEKGIAARAEQAADLAGGVAVVNEKFALNLTDETSPPLRLAHHLDVVWCESVLALEARPEVLRASSLGILPPPLPQALVPASLVRLCVLASDGVAALLAVRASLRTVAVACASKRFGRLRQAALRAGLGIHRPSLAVPRDMAPRDQPCHADVLLELANGDLS